MSRVSWSDASRCRAQKLWVAHCCSKQQRLYFLPLPQGNGPFLPKLTFPEQSIMSTHYPPKSEKTRAEVMTRVLVAAARNTSAAVWSSNVPPTVFGHGNETHPTS